MMSEILSLTAVGLAIYSSVKVSQFSTKLNFRDREEINVEITEDFVARLNLGQLQALEMTLQFRAATYRVSDIFCNDFELVRDYNILLDKLGKESLIDYEDLIISRINKLNLEKHYAELD